MTRRIRFSFGEMSIFRGGTSLGERGIDWFDRLWAEVMVGRGPIPSFRGQSHLVGRPSPEFAGILNFLFSVKSLYGVSSLGNGFSRDLVFHAVLMCRLMQILEAAGPKYLLKAY